MGPRYIVWKTSGMEPKKTVDIALRLSRLRRHTGEYRASAGYRMATGRFRCAQMWPGTLTRQIDVGIVLCAYCTVSLPERQ
jgi:hypothetical protein